MFKNLSTSVRLFLRIIWRFIFFSANHEKCARAVTQFHGRSRNRITFGLALLLYIHAAGMPNDVHTRPPFAVRAVRFVRRIKDHTLFPFAASNFYFFFFFLARRNDRAAGWLSANLPLNFSRFASAGFQCRNIYRVSSLSVVYALRANRAESARNERSALRIANITRYVHIHIATQFINTCILG